MPYTHYYKYTCTLRACELTSAKNAQYKEKKNSGLMSYNTLPEDTFYIYI